MRARFIVLGVLAVTVAQPAAAETTPAGGSWEKIAATTNNADMFLAFQALSATEWFAGGVRMDMSSQIPVISPILYWTQDGGAMLKPFGQGISGFGVTISSVAFQDWQHGFAVADKVYWRDPTETKGNWGIHKAVPADVMFVHYVDAQHLVLATKTGQISRSEDAGKTWTPCEVPPTDQAEPQGPGFLFLDGKTGFLATVAGETQQVEQGQGNTKEVTSYRDLYLLGTTDGGASWKVVWKEAPPADAPGGRLVNSLFFLPDGKHGWMGTATWDSEQGRMGPAALLKTEDGGESWRDMKVPVDVGTGLFGMPVKTSYFLVQYWDDTRNGHLGGSAYIGEQGSGGGASSPPIVRNVDYVTRDGGVTWDRTDVGTVSFDMGGGSAPSTDGRLFSGAMRSFFEGWMAGESGNIYRYRFKCIKNSQCGPGYECWKQDLQCHRVEATTGDNAPSSDLPSANADLGPAQGDLASSTCTAGTVACDGNRRMECTAAGLWALAENCASTGGTCQGGVCRPAGSSGSGCAAGGGPNPFSGLLLLALGAAIAAYRRARS